MKKSEALGIIYNAVSDHFDWGESQLICSERILEDLIKAGVVPPKIFVNAYLGYRHEWEPEE